MPKWLRKDQPKPGFCSLSTWPLDIFPTSAAAIFAAFAALALFFAGPSSQSASSRGLARSWTPWSSTTTGLLPKALQGIWLMEHRSAAASCYVLKALQSSQWRRAAGEKNWKSGLAWLLTERIRIEACLASRPTFMRLVSGDLSFGVLGSAVQGFRWWSRKPIMLHVQTRVPVQECPSTWTSSRAMLPSCTANGNCRYSNASTFSSRCSRTSPALQAGEKAFFQTQRTSRKHL